ADPGVCIQGDLDVERVCVEDVPPDREVRAVRAPVHADRLLIAQHLDWRVFALRIVQPDRPVSGLAPPSDQEPVTVWFPPDRTNDGRHVRLTRLSNRSESWHKEHQQKKREARTPKYLHVHSPVR